MKDNYNIDKEIERTIHSLGGIVGAEPNPFFYTRLKARMEKELTSPRKVMGWQVKPIYMYSLLVGILALNSFTIMMINDQNHSKTEKVQVYRLYDANQ